MAEYGNNYNYGDSPFYKDDTNTMGAITISKKGPNDSSFVPKEFPLIDVIPTEVAFGITGLEFLPISYSWDFGDGTCSTKKNPSHIYTTHGYHRVFAYVKDRVNGVPINVGGYGNYVVLGKIDFNGDPKKGDKPLEVLFQEESIAPTGCQFTGIQWDFGDSFGATGIQRPPHTYIDYGSYSVNMKTTFDKI